MNGTALFAFVVADDKLEAAAVPPGLAMTRVGVEATPAGPRPDEQHPPAAPIGMNDVTRLLDAIERGDPRAANALLPLVYDELRLLAARRLAREDPGQTLQATALVHEAYLRLVGPGGRGDEDRWDSRGHFFAAAAEAMRRILVDRARHDASQKHGGGLMRHDVEAAQIAAPATQFDLLALDEALAALARSEPRLARLVELRYFAGLTLKQAAEVIGVSPRTADADWAYAKAFLFAELAGDEA